MRKIEFRAERKGSNELVYGYYVQLEDKHFIVDKDSMIGFRETKFGEKYTIENIVEIKPKTLSQYTNKEDTNDNKLYEGDKVKGEVWVHGKYRKFEGRIAFSQGGFVVAEYNLSLDKFTSMTNNEIYKRR